MAASFVDATTQVDLAATSSTIAVPSSTNGDLLICMLHAHAATGPFDITRPDFGWTVLTAAGHTTSQFQMSARRADNEPTDYTWTFDETSDIAMIMLCYSPAELKSHYTAATDLLNTYTAGSATSRFDDQRILRIYGSVGDGSETITVPSATTARAEIEQAEAWLAIGDETQASAGATGTADFTTSGTGTNRLVVTYVIENLIGAAGLALFVD